MKNSGITCFICCDNFEVPETYELPCSHIFCKNCLQNLFLTKINSATFTQDQINCPSCQQGFDSNLLKDILTPQMFQRYCERTIQLNIPQGIAENEVMIDCLNPNCSDKFIIWKEADYYTCPSCHLKYCRKCSYQYHANINCQQNKQLQTYTKSIIKFRGENKDLVKDCPHCCSMIEKKNGCNFMTCSSTICKGAKYFCFVCEVPLLNKDKFSHFKNDDSFQGECLVKYNEKWIDKKNVPVLKNVTPCPKCQTLDPKVCRIEPNFGNRAAYCICSNTTYCLICKQALTDNLLLEHMQTNFQCQKLDKQVQ